MRKMSHYGIQHYKHIFIALHSLSARMGDYKLFVGSPGHYSDWYPPPTGRRNKLHIRLDEKVEHRYKNITLLYNIKGKQ